MTPAYLQKESMVKKNQLIGKERKDFQKILERSKKNSGSYYDCIVPVSGGKDSTWQVYVMKKKHKMNPLAITFDQFDQTNH